MLSAVGNPVAVNPDRELRRHAEDHQWQVRDFRRPVRLRSRFGGTSPRSSIAAVAAVAAIAAIFGWVVIRSRLAGRSAG
jgi:hypothetical protein